MTRKLDLPPLKELHRRYVAGESSVDLARALACHSSTLRNAFARHGLPVRTQSEARSLVNAGLSPHERKRRASAAQTAARGRVVGMAEKRRRAASREEAPPAMSQAEALVRRALESWGYTPRFQRACGPYNIDFALGESIAVEVFGGLWHAHARHAARHPKRTRHLLRAGYDVVICWCDRRKRFAAIDALKEVLADLKLRRRDPSAPCQYRMIWRDGYLMTRSAKDHHFPLVPAREVRRNALGRYEAVS